MPYANTPGKHLGYWSGTISGSAVTIFTVPVGYVFYIDYLMIGAFTPIQGSPAAIYIGADGVPLMMLSQNNIETEMSFVKPIICTTSLIVGPLGTVSNLVSAVASWSGEVR